MTSSSSSKYSLRSTLLAWLVPTVLILLLASAALSYRSTMRFAHTAYDTGLHDTVMLLSERVVVGLNEITVDLPPEIDRILTSDPVDRVYFRVVTADDKTIGGDARIPKPPTARLSSNRPVFYDGTLAEEQVRCAAVSIGSNDSRSVIVIAAETLKKRNVLARNVILSAVLPGLILAALCVVVIWLGIKHGLAPLGELASAVARRGWNDLSPVDETRAPTEARPLVSATNSLMHRLAASLAAQQRFIGDASHQLRTPIAGLLAQTERALDEKDPERLRTSLQHLKSSAVRMVRLVNQLLTLARAEPGANPSSRFQKVDLARVVYETCANWVPRALAHGVDLGFEGVESGIMIQGDEVLLGEMVNNLIDNAIRYGPENGTVTVSLSTMPQLELTVADDGNSLSDANIALLFQRFHRSPNSPPGGSGLGLAIVKEIALAHGADVGVRRATADGGTAFTISFGPAVQYERAVEGDSKASRKVMPLTL